MQINLETNKEDLKQDIKEIVYYKQTLKSFVENRMLIDKYKINCSCLIIILSLLKTNKVLLVFYNTLIGFINVFLIFLVFYLNSEVSKKLILKQNTNNTENNLKILDILTYLLLGIQIVLLMYTII